MAAFEESGKNAYRADCVAPVKDTRVQTAVCTTKQFIALCDKFNVPTLFHAQILIPYFFSIISIIVFYKFIIIINNRM